MKNKEYLLKEWENLGLSITDKGKPYCNEDNTMKILSLWEPIKGLFWCSRKTGNVCTKNEFGETVPWSELDSLRLKIKFQRELKFEGMSLKILTQMVEISARQQWAENQTPI